MKKILWIDVETSGIDWNKNCILQLSALVEIERKVVEEYNAFMKPFKGDTISKEALNVTGITVDQLKTFRNPVEVLSEFKQMMEKYVNPYDKMDKFILGGKNFNFDRNFIKRWFEKCEDEYFWSWFHFPYLDIEQELARVMLFETDLVLPNYQLKTVCELLDIQLDAHNSLSDIKATREIFWMINGE